MPEFANKFPENKWFSTKEKRDEYILMNKPLFSVQLLVDIMDLGPKTTGILQENAKKIIENQ